ncbi:MAG TPA: serine hydrolase [Thermoanaerobaculia bacterium]|nr:serine hydrolase [Thermoanaerobaculia bacterium]
MRRVISFVLLLLASIARAETPVDKLALDAMKQWKLPGLAIAIVKDDKVVLTKGYGVKEIGGTAPITDETLFQIASTSKAFTTTAMAMLVDEKKLAWDDPVRQHVVYFHLNDGCADSLVTLRDIVSHRTGLSRHDELWDNSGLSREEVIRAIGSVALTKPYRSAYQYNNIMFMTAGEAVAHASGMAWDDFVRTRIFIPLGMTRSITTFAQWNASADHASAHRYDAKTGTVSIIKAIDEDNLGPAGTIASCARDMAQWLRFQLADGTIDAKRLVSADALNETKTPQMTLRLDGPTRELNPETNLLAYGMGWNISDYFGSKVISHAGALNSMRTQAVLLPKEHAGFVLMTNVGRGTSLLALRMMLTDLLLNRTPRDWNAYYLALDKKIDDEAAAKKVEREAKRHRDTHPSRELAAYAATYENAGYGPLAVTLENGALVLRWRRLTLPLTHFNYDTFSAFSEPDDVDEQVEFRLDASGEVKMLTMFGETFTRR